MFAPTALVSKLWNYCSILRDEDLSYDDHVEQLPFLKMADEQSRLRSAPIISAPTIPILNVINITGKCQAQF